MQEAIALVLVLVQGEKVGTAIALAPALVKLLEGEGTLLAATQKSSSKLLAEEFDSL